MIPAELLARPGDSIREKYKRLAEWIDAQKLKSSDHRVYVSQTGDGQTVRMVQDAPIILTPLKVSLVANRYYRVSEGYINGRLPMIQPANGNLQSIVNEDGVLHHPARLPTDRPILVVAEVKFKGDLSLDTVTITTKLPKKLLRTGTANYSSAGSGSITGHIPLAFLRKNAFIQFTLHNLQVRAYRDGSRPRVIYWPA